MSGENILLKDILNNNTLYEVEEDKNNELQYKLKGDEKIRICELDNLSFDDKLLGGNVGIFTIGRGASPRPIANFITDKNAKEKFGWLKISDVTASNIYLKKVKEYITSEGKEKSKLGKKGDLLLTNSMTVGVPIILDIDTCFHDGFLYFKDPKIEIYNLYVYYFFINYKKKLEAISKGGIVKNLNTDLIKDEYIQIPSKFKNYSSLELQKSIAKNIEDKFSNIKNKINTLCTIEKLIDMKIEKYLDDKIKYIKLSNKKMELNLVENNIIFNFVKGKRVTSSQISDLKNKINDIPVFSASKFDNEVLGFSNKIFLQNNGNTIIYNNCVLINTDGTGAGKTRIKNEIFAINDVVFAIELLDTKISLNYIKRVIDSELNKHNLGYANKLYEQDLQKKDIKVIIPLKSDGKIDYTLINEIDDDVEQIKHKSINTSNMKKVLEFSKGKVWSI